MLADLKNTQRLIIKEHSKKEKHYTKLKYQMLQDYSQNFWENTTRD